MTKPCQHEWGVNRLGVTVCGLCRLWRVDAGPDEIADRVAKVPACTHPEWDNLDPEGFLAWCMSCGALREDGKWVLPGAVTTVSRTHWEEAIYERDEARKTAAAADCLGPWQWQQEGGNDLDSMGDAMVVRMTAGQLRLILTQERAEMRAALYPATADIVQEEREYWVAIVKKLVTCAGRIDAETMAAELVNIVMIAGGAFADRARRKPTETG